VALLLGLVAINAANAASQPVEVQSVRVGFGPGNSFKVGAWTPVWVQLGAGDERFTGFMDLVVPDDDGIPTSYRQPIDIGARQSQRFTAYTRPGGRDTEFTIRIFNSRGHRVLETPQAMSMSKPPEVIMPNETLILTMGQPIGVDQIPNLPGFATARQNRQGASGPEIVVARLDSQQDAIPGRWYGYEAAMAIVVDTGDREVLQSLDALRGQALADWVKRGGHLVVSVASNWQAVRDSVLGPLLPALPSGQEQVSSLEPLEAFADSTKPLTPPGAPPVMVTKLEEIDRRGGKVLTGIGSDLPLIVRGAHGFGRVTLIGVAVDQKLFSAWPDRGLFWARAIDLKHDRPDQSSAGTRVGGGTRFIQSGVSDLSSQLRIGLEQFPNVKLIPFGWVAFFIFLYILLIGPGDYFFLKKVLKRMELTWITFPTIVITVSLLAYFAAYRLKGNDLLVNKVDVIDVDQTAGLLRGRTLLSVFSPQNRDYNIGFIPVPPNLDHDLSPVATLGPSGELPRPPAGTEVLTSWFSVPEPQFGAMGGSNRRFSFVGGGYSYEPSGGLERLESVRIPIWSTKTITAQWYGPASPMIDSDLHAVGHDRLAGTVTNRQSFPLGDSILAFNKQVYLLGTLAPGATISVALSSDRFLSNHLRSKIPNYASDQSWNRNQKINRADILVSLMFHESETNRSNDQTLSNVTLHELDLTGQLALDRPMLVGKIDRPGAQLALGNAASPAKVDQTTVIRFILPLKQTAHSGKAALPNSGPAVAHIDHVADRSYKTTTSSDSHRGVPR
jgi:hypothetical protein